MKSAARRVPCIARGVIALAILVAGVTGGATKFAIHAPPGWGK